MVKIIKYSITLIIFAIISSLFVLYFYLLKGIELKNLHYNNINLENLYIKIDKKIILKAKNLQLKTKSSNKPVNFKDTIKIVKNILQYLNYFQEIQLKQIAINNQKFDIISFHQNHFIVDNQEIFLNASLNPKPQKIYIQINELNLKPIDIIFHNIKGDFYSDLLYLYVNVQTIYNQAQIHLNLKIGNKKVFYNGEIYNITQKVLPKKIDNLKFEILSFKFKGNQKKASFNIENILAKFKNNEIYTPNVKGNFYITKKHLVIQNENLLINKTIKLFNTNINYNLNQKYAFIQNNKIAINDYNLSLLNNKLSFDQNKNSLNFNSKNIKLEYLAKCDISNLSLNYNQNKIITTIPVININYQNILANLNQNKIIYNLENNTSNINIKNILIDNQIKINNLITIFKNQIINTQFKTNTLLSKHLTTILKKFNINIPIYQINGTNKILANIKYNLKSKKLFTNIKIDTSKSKLFLAKDTFLNINYANLNLKNNKIFLQNSDVDFNKSIVNVNYFINKGLIDLNKFFISLNGKIKYLNISNILTLQNYPENIFINLKNLNIQLQNLKTNISINKKVKIDINKLSLFYPYIKYLKEYKIQDGNIKITIDKNIKIDTNITKTSQPILLKNLKPLNKLQLQTLIKNNTYSIFTKDLNVQIKNENTLQIKGNYKNLDFNLTKFLEKNSSKETNSTEKNSSLKLNIDLNGSNSYLLFFNSKLYSDKFSLNYKKNKATITSLYKDRNITILYNNQNLKIYGLKIQQKTFEDLTNTKILRNPLITFFGIKNKNSQILQGFVEIQRGYIKELKALNNVIAFINLIPALVTFHSPGFSNKGYKIRDAYIEYILYNNVLYFKKLVIKGVNLTFNGQGYIDLNKKTIKMNVDVNIIVKLIKDIPIVNYILLGKDGGITLKLTVDGDLKDPKVHKNTAQNIIEAPFEILKRAIQTPFRPFMKEEE